MCSGARKEGSAVARVAITVATRSNDSPACRVRPYALTQGRTRYTGESFDLVATVLATRRAIADPSSLAPEHISVLQLARTPTTVADIASDVDLPLGVVRILLADLRELGLVAISSPVAMADRIDKHILREVLNGLRAL